MDKTTGDLAIAVFGGSLSLAGILLVFMGFIFTQAQGFQNNLTLTDVYKNVAKVGLIPFTLAVIDAGLCVLTLQHPTTAIYSTYMLRIFWTELIVTLVYGIVSVLRFL